MIQLQQIDHFGFIQVLGARDLCITAWTVRRAGRPAEQRQARSATTMPYPKPTQPRKAEATLIQTPQNSLTDEILTLGSEALYRIHQNEC